MTQDRLFFADIGEQDALFEVEPVAPTEGVTVGLDCVACGGRFVAPFVCAPSDSAWPCQQVGCDRRYPDTRWVRIECADGSAGFQSACHEHADMVRRARPVLCPRCRERGYEAPELF